MKEFVLFLLILSDTSCLYIYLKIQFLFFFFPVTVNLNNVNVEFHVWNSVYLKHFFLQVSSSKVCPRAWSWLENRDWLGILCRIITWIGITLAFQWEKSFLCEILAWILKSFPLFKIFIHMGVDVNCFVKLLKCFHSPRMLISLFCLDIFSLMLSCLGFFPLILGSGQREWVWPFVFNLTHLLAET